MPISPELLAFYQDFKQGRGYYVDTELSIAELTGRDRAAFLHNFCTADIKNLKAGESTEAFVLNPKGKTIAFILVLCHEDRLQIVSGRAGQSELQNHLEKYVIVEDVRIQALENGSVRFCSWQSDDFFATAIGPGIFIDSRAEPLDSEGKTEVPPQVFEMIRIENRFPRPDIDVRDDCLPQELERDATAISFNKGCYLGQETVARLDALGHTNRTFCLLKTEVAPLPENDTELRIDGQPCGQVTSRCWSPEHEAFLMLAMVRKPHHRPGTTMELGEVRTSVL